VCGSDQSGQRHVSVSQPAPLSCYCTELSAESGSACHGSWSNGGWSLSCSCSLYFCASKKEFVHY